MYSLDDLKALSKYNVPADSMPPLGEQTRVNDDVYGDHVSERILRAWMTLNRCKCKPSSETPDFSAVLVN